MDYILKYLRAKFKYKYVFQAIFLFFSCYLLVNYLTGLIADPVLKKGVALFAICLDVSMQFVILARGKKSWRKGKWSKGFTKYRVMALLLFFLYGVYVIFYAVLSAVGFFLVEVDRSEAKIAEFKIVQSDNRQRLNEIAAEMDALTVQLKTEGGTGYGRNSKMITGRMDQLKAEREALCQSNGATSPVKAKLTQNPVNSFEILSQNLGIPQSRLKILIFGISVIMLQVIIILTSWSGEVARTDQTVIKVREPEPESIEPISDQLIDYPDQDQNELSQYVAALFTDTKKLNGDQTIAKKTGISPERCAIYRKHLSELIIGNKAVIRTKKGGSVSDFTKEELQDFIRNNELKSA